MPLTGISGDNELFVTTRSNGNLPPLVFCHCPPTSEVGLTFLGTPLAPYCDRTDDGVELGRTGSVGDGLLVGAAGAGQHVEAHLEQGVHEADELRPLLAGRLFVLVRQIERLLAGQRAR